MVKMQKHLFLSKVWDKSPKKALFLTFVPSISVFSHILNGTKLDGTKWDKLLGQTFGDGTNFFRVDKL